MENAQAVRGFRQFKAVGGRVRSDGLKLSHVISCVPVSITECERALSTMKNILNQETEQVRDRHIVISDDNQHHGTTDCSIQPCNIRGSLAEARAPFSL